MSRHYRDHQFNGGRSTILSDYDRNTNYPAFEDRQSSGYQPPSQADALIKIERFVNLVIASDQPAYIFRDSAHSGYTATATTLGKRLLKVISLVGLFDSYHDYSEHPYAFLDACWLMESVYGLDLSRPVNNAGEIDGHYAEAMNAIVAKIRMSSREYWFMRALSDRKYEAVCKARTLAEYTSELLRYYARMMIVRVDLSYLESTATGLTIDQVYADLDRLLYLKELHPIFKCLVGYAWTIEQGENQGFHIHVVFFFDGSKECRDIYKGFEIGGLWQQDITQGQGKYHNCNAHRQRYERLGIGMIHRNSAEECANAIACIPYLAKDTQYLRIRPQGRRVFGTGSSPDFENKRGRPPTHF